MGLRRFLRRLGLIRKKDTLEYAIQDVPVFDEAGLAYFISRVRQSKIYLEYGMGGSTILASQIVDKLFAVDSDRRFLDAVQKKLDEQPRRAACHLIHANIGITGAWGRPVRRDYKPGREPAKWRAYPETPWFALKEQALEPDTILVDGRFRVASALATLRNLAADSESEILFDDYAERPWYHGLQDYAVLHAMHGRMGVFKKNPAIAPAILNEALLRYGNDWR